MKPEPCPYAYIAIEARTIAGAVEEAHDNYLRLADRCHESPASRAEYLAASAFWEDLERHRLALHEMAIRHLHDIDRPLVEVGRPRATPIEGRGMGPLVSELRRIEEQARAKRLVIKPTICTAIAASHRFAVSAKTISRYIDDGRLTDHRAKKHAKNAPLLVDVRELEKHFAKK